LANQDVFLNIAGGLRVEDPAVDLAVCASVLSSLQDISIPNTICFAGEVGLSGEVRAVTRIENRVIEAEKLGFRQIMISEFAKRPLEGQQIGIKLQSVQQIVQMADLLGL
jgi:DNA repair protein RadA/Sms